MNPMNTLCVIYRAIVHAYSELRMTDLNQRWLRETKEYYHTSCFSAESFFLMFLSDMYVKQRFKLRTALAILRCPFERHWQTIWS